MKIIMQSIVYGLYSDTSCNAINQRQSVVDGFPITFSIFSVRMYLDAHFSVCKHLYYTVLLFCVMFCHFKI
jgi:hypothetical protein